MKPEEKARQHIDKMLKASGWIVQDFNQYNPYAGLGIAVELPHKKSTRKGNVASKINLLEKEG